MLLYARCFDIISTFALRTLSVMRETPDSKQKGQMVGAFFIYNQLLMMLRYTLPGDYPIHETIRKMHDDLEVFPDEWEDIQENMEVLLEDEFDTSWSAIIECIKRENIDELIDGVSEFIDETLTGQSYPEADLLAGMNLAVVTLENLTAANLEKISAAACAAPGRHLH